ncbi:MAG: hypothetical protein G01um101438_771 [Parcubacteria group bacterium Gr01-1014_38]|nr:MAG: hypothetical protein G01um101438_771 [Parcubacteria group bacterium Gr01-1014_38]
MALLLLRRDLEKYLQKHQLAKKWAKARRLFEQNIRHPSLNVELLEPRWRGIYSFRIDQKYRALFFLVDGKAEVFAITKHYRKG